MDFKLVSENDKSFTVLANGKEIQVAKTPGASKLLGALKAKGASVTPAGKIPGKAKVPGDSPENDTVQIKASPGEGIIPREAMQSPEAAIEFVKRMFANKESGGMKMNKGGKVDPDCYMFKGGKLCYYGGGPVVDPEEAKKAAESMRKAFHFALGGVVPEKVDQSTFPPDDKDDGIDEPVDINGMYSEGGVVKEEDDEEDDEPMKSAPVTGGYFDGGAVLTDMAPEDAIPAPSLNEPMAPAPAPNPAFTAPGPTNVNYVAPAQTADQAGAVITSPDQTLPNGVTAPAATATATSPTQMKETTTKQTHGMLGKDEAKVTKTSEASAKATEAIGDLAATQLQKEAAETKRYVQEIDQKNNEFETNKIFRQTQIENKWDDLNKTKDQYLSMKIDPKHLWGDEGTGNRLMAAAGIILGGFGQAFNGKENGALQIVDNALKRDLEIQKANIAKAGDNVDTQSSMFKQFKDKLGDEAAAEKMTLATMKERYANQLDLIAKTAGSEQTRAQATQAAAKIRADAAADIAKVGGYVNTTVQQEATPKPLGDAPQGVQDKYLGLISGSKQLRSIKDQYESMGDVGPLDVRANRLLGMIGFDDPKLTTLDAKIMMGVANLLHQKSGTGASEKEFNRMKDQYPDLTKNPKTFQLFLNNELQKADTEIKDLQDAYSGYQRLPNDTRGPTKQSLGMTKTGK